jgi:hypothetical protein
MSYDDTLPTELDKVRHYVGDISNNPATELRTDDHIEAALAEHGFNLAVAVVAEGLAAEYAQEPGSVRLPDGLTVSWPERVKFWLGRATEYRGYAAAEAAETTTVARVSVAVPIRVVW